MTARPPLLQITNLTKKYGDFTAVDNVSLEIEPGEIFALLGPNGAGKTSLIGCATGLKSRFTGKIHVAGHCVVDQYAITRRLIGLVPQELNYDAFFNLRQVIAFQAGYFGQRNINQRVDKLLHDFSLTEKADKNTRWLSGGMKRRLMICKALVHDPVLLFLDEPSAGVDVELREELWEYVLRLRERGTTIVLTTHYIEEAERLADRIGFIRQGRLLRVDDREQLLASVGTRRSHIELDRPKAQHIHDTLSMPSLTVVSPTSLELESEDGDRMSLHTVVKAVLETDAVIASISEKRSTLEDVFRTIMESHP